MTIIPLQDVWLEANFKEKQIRNLRIGQEALIVSDVYGSDVVFHGHVIGLSAGTGAAFSLLPPQNASGNWIKVTQRLPVKIALDPKELANASATHSGFPPRPRWIPMIAVGPSWPLRRCRMCTKPPPPTPWIPRMPMQQP